MKKIYGHLIFVFFIFLGLLSSCSGFWETVQEGEIDGKKYTIQSKETKGFSTNSFRWRIKIDGQKPLDINANNYDWGPVYDPEIFGNNRFVVLDKNQNQYTNIPLDFYNNQMRGATLYIPCKSDKDEYCNAYFDLFTKKWNELKPIFKEMKSAGFPEIKAIVSGQPEDFEKRFFGKFEGQKVVFSVKNDGRIQLSTDGPNSVDIGGTYYRKLIMPGKKIYIEKGNSNFTKKSLLQFKDKKGFSPDHYFNIEETSINQDFINIEKMYEKALGYYQNNDKKAALDLFKNVYEYANNRQYPLYSVKSCRYLAELYKENGDRENFNFMIGEIESISTYNPSILDSIQSDLDVVKKLKEK